MSYGFGGWISAESALFELGLLEPGTDLVELKGEDGTFLFDRNTVS